MWCATQTTELARPAASSLDWDAAWAAWLAGRPNNTVLARLLDLRTLASYLGVVDERSAARALVAAGPGTARALAHAWTDAQRRTSVAPATIARRLATVASLFSELELHGLPWSLQMRRPKIPRYQAQPCPSWAAVQRVAASLERARNWPELLALRLLSDVGLRRTEVTSLRRADVLELEGREGPHVIDVVRKGNIRVRRTISRRAWAVIDRLELRPDAKLIAGQRGALTDSGLLRWVRRWGLGSPHALRRAGATELRRRGVDVFLIRAWLGHASLATTQVYVLELDDQAGQATAELEASA